MTRKTTTVYTIAEKIAALDIATPEDVTTWAPAIIEAFKGTDLFYEFDIREGDMDRATGGRFGLVRSLRNSPKWGPLLIEAATSRKQ